MYKILSKYYDAIMGQSYRDEYVDILKNICNCEEIIDKSILDLGCGTGSFLSLLSQNNTSYGIDISNENIKIAKNKDVNSTYILGDISEFNIDKKFDIISCCFDTINHLIEKKSWESLFLSSKKHLKENGFFLFDYNTIEKLKDIDGKSLVNQVGENYLIIETVTVENICTFHIKEFKKIGDLYKKNTENIKEISFSYKEIEIMLLKVGFTKIDILKTESGRVFLSCQ